MKWVGYMLTINNNDDAEVWNDDQSTMAHHADTTDDGQRQATPLQCSVICIVLLIQAPTFPREPL